MMQYRGERYEVRYDRERPGGNRGDERILGWSDDPTGGPLAAAARAAGLHGVRVVELHPTGNLA